MVSAALYAMGIYGLEIFNPEDYRLPEKDYTWDYIDDEVLEKQKEEAYVCAYVGNTPAGVDQLNGIRSDMERLKTVLDMDLGRLFVEATTMENEDWTNNWKRFFKPLNVGESFIVTPEWEQPENTEGKTVLTVNPGGIFGTGSHETTQLCMCAIERTCGELLEKKGDVSGILDIGTGTGILSIAALLKGVKRAVCVDIDPNADVIVDENMAMNAISKDRYTVQIGNILDDDFAASLEQAQFELVTANIMADILIEMMPGIPRFLMAESTLILSGIIVPRLADVREAVERAGLAVKYEEINGEWCCVCAGLKA